MNAVHIFAGFFSRHNYLFQFIYKHWMNTLVNYCGPFSSEMGYCKRLENYIGANLQWIQEQIDQEPHSPYWYQVWKRNGAVT